MVETPGGRFSRIEVTLEQGGMSHPVFTLDQILTGESQDRNARLTVFAYLRQMPVHLSVVGDSRQYGQAPSGDPVAQEAAEVKKNRKNSQANPDRMTIPQTIGVA
jgi:hypothetical protein